MDALDRLFSGMRVSSTGLMAERVRMDVISENIANARTTRTADGEPYRRKLVYFQPILEDRFRRGGGAPEGVGVPYVGEDHSSEYMEVMEPGHPDADAEGMVRYPNVNAVVEMADLVTAMRAYEANLTAQQGFVQMAERALELLR